MNDYTEYMRTRLIPSEDETRLQIGSDVHRDHQILDRLCSTTVNTWLEKEARGYCELKHNEQLAILHFTLLWSYFEATVLDGSGGASVIVDATKRWAIDRLLTKDSFEPEVSYFRERYFVGGKFTSHFKHLRLQKSVSLELRKKVKNVLQNMDATSHDLATVVLIIVYRIRNNLFHGEKWSYGLRGQFDNFNHANAALMKAMNLQGKVAKK